MMGDGMMFFVFLVLVVLIVWQQFVIWRLSTESGKLRDHLWEKEKELESLKPRADRLAKGKSHVG